METKRLEALPARLRKDAAVHFTKRSSDTQGGKKKEKKSTLQLVISGEQ